MSDGFSLDQSICRVEVFRETGKWYCTEAVPFIDYDHYNLPAAFVRSLWAHLQGRLAGMTAVCFDPHNNYQHPVMVTIPTINPYRFDVDGSVPAKSTVPLKDICPFKTEPAPDWVEEIVPDETR